MPTPFHPVIVHFPIAITFILPFMILAFAMLIKSHKMSPQAWLIVVGLQLASTVTGYIALESGETEEAVVEKVVGRQIIHEHEQAAEIFVGLTVVTLVLSIAAFFILKNMQFYLQMGIAALSLVTCYLAYNTGDLGGELVYRHGAANVYAQVRNTEDIPQGILPTPGKNTSESPHPVDDNESLKPDDNDYGNADEVEENDDDGSKQED